jgi:hypothetical protein
MISPIVGNNKRIHGVALRTRPDSTQRPLLPLARLAPRRSAPRRPAPFVKVIQFVRPVAAMVHFRAARRQPRRTSAWRRCGDVDDVRWPVGWPVGLPVVPPAHDHHSPALAIVSACSQGAAGRRRYADHKRNSQQKFLCVHGRPPSCRKGCGEPCRILTTGCNASSIHARTMLGACQDFPRRRMLDSWCTESRHCPV